ncbi:MAG: NAD(P)-dependent oxidoreductase [Bacteroidota bacterium]
MEIELIQNRKILITGGSGFIGTNLIEALRHHTVFILNISRGKPRNPEHLEYFFQTDIRDTIEVKKVVQDFSPDFIIHLAAKTGYGNSDDKEGFLINTEGTKNIISAANLTPSVRRLIVASSNVVDREDRAFQYTYIKSKRAAESMLQSSIEGHFQWCIVRPCFVWGPWFGAPFKDYFLSIAHSKYVHPGTVDSLRFAGYAGNVAHQLIRLLQASDNQFNKQTFYLTDYQPLSLREWSNLISRQMGKKIPSTLPEFLVQVAAKLGDIFSSVGYNRFPMTSKRLQNMRTNAVDIPIAKTEEVAGPLPFTLIEGVDETIRWLKNQKLL